MTCHGNIYENAAVHSSPNVFAKMRPSDGKKHVISDTLLAEREIPAAFLLIRKYHLHF